MKTNFRNPPIHEITVTRGQVWLNRADAIVGVIVLLLGGFAIACHLCALIIR